MWQKWDSILSRNNGVYVWKNKKNYNLKLGQIRLLLEKRNLFQNISPEDEPRFVTMQGFIWWRCVRNINDRMCTPWIKELHLADWPVLSRKGHPPDTVAFHTNTLTIWTSTIHQKLWISTALIARGHVSTCPKPFCMASSLSLGGHTSQDTGLW